MLNADLKTGEGSLFYHAASEKAAVKKAAKLLFDKELMGSKRMKEIVRWADKR